MATKLQGADAMQRKLMRLIQKFPDRVVRAVYRRCEAVMTRSKNEFVPVDLGTLRGTGSVAVERNGRTVTGVMAYGGPATSYALAVHEHLSGYSPPSWQAAGEGGVSFSPAGRGPKYLEKPLFQALPTMPAELAADIALESLAAGS